MKKIFLIIVIILILGCIWLLVQDTRITIYGISNEDQSLFSQGTDNRIIWDAEDGNSGTYTADNFVELVRYQNRIFKIAKEKNIDFTSFADGPFIAKWVD